MTSRILPPRIALVIPRTGDMVREWYLYFRELAKDVQVLEAADFDLSPSAAQLTGLDASGAAQDAIGIAPSADASGLASIVADVQQYGVSPQSGDLLARVAALENIVNELRLGAPVL